MVGNRGDGVVHDDRGDDGSAGAGHADHETGGDGASHRTLNDSADRADTFHSTVSAKKLGSSEKWQNAKEKNTDRVQQKQVKHGVSQMW